MKTKFFWSKQWNGTNHSEIGFSPRSEPHSAKLYFSNVFKFFNGNWLETSLLGQKNYLPQKVAKNYTEFFFFQQVWKWENHEEKFRFDGNKFFGQTSERGQILEKMVILLKIRHRQVNYVFLVFWSFFSGIAWKLLIWINKLTISEKAQKLRKLSVLNTFEN